MFKKFLKNLEKKRKENHYIEAKKSGYKIINYELHNHRTKEILYRDFFYLLVTIAFWLSIGLFYGIMIGIIFCENILAS